MAPDLLYDIIDLCYSVDKIAEKIYSDLSGFYSGTEKGFRCQAKFSI
jgi:hypothetical protein